jgi:hypothetical protein
VSCPNNFFQAELFKRVNLGYVPFKEARAVNKTPESNMIRSNSWTEHEPHKTARRRARIAQEEVETLYQAASVEHAWTLDAFYNYSVAIGEHTFQIGFDALEIAANLTDERWRSIFSKKVNEKLAA